MSAEGSLVVRVTAHRGDEGRSPLTEVRGDRYLDRAMDTEECLGPDRPRPKAHQMKACRQDPGQEAGPVTGQPQREPGGLCGCAPRATGLGRLCQHAVDKSAVYQWPRSQRLEF